MADKNTRSESYDDVELVQDYLPRRWVPDVDPAIAKLRLMEFLDKVQEAETGGEGENFATAINPDTLATGPFQYKTKGKRNPFDTGVSRASTTYKRFGSKSVPKWLREAKKHRDPLKLTLDQSRELVLGDLYQQTPRKNRATGKNWDGTTELFKRVMRGGPDSRDAAMTLYSVYHHTNPDVILKDPRIRNIFGFEELAEDKITYKAGGGFISPNPGRKLI